MTRRLRPVLLFIPLGIYALISLYPLFWMLLFSLKDNNEIFSTNPFGFPLIYRWDNYQTAISQFNVIRYFFNSMVISVISVFFGVLLSLFYSYGLVRMNWKYSKFGLFFTSVGLFIPVQIIMIPLVVMVRRLGLADTYLAIIVPYIAMGIPLSTLVFWGFMKSIPFSLEESAFIEGAGRFQSFLRIILPLMIPAVSTVVIYQFMQNWNEFSLALILIQKEAMKTLPLGLLSFRGQFSVQWGAMGASLIIASIPTIALYLSLSDKVEKALSLSSGIKE